MKISLIGSGNVAWHLAPALEDVGHQIVEVYSRNKKNAQKIAQKLYDAKINIDLDFDDSVAQLFILAIADDAIEEVIKQIILPENCLLVHTSGSKSLEWFDNLVKIHHDLPIKTGVFYPLMTFSKTKIIDFKNVPFCIEAIEETSKKNLVKIAQQLSKIVYSVSSEERKTLHLSAVFACNFTNHLLALSQKILEEKGLGFELLKPLIEETITKALLAKHPADVQTGPAIRGDESTIKQHLSQLKGSPDLQKVYKTMTESIQNID